MKALLRTAAVLLAATLGLAACSGTKDREAGPPEFGNLEIETTFYDGFNPDNRHEEEHRVPATAGTRVQVQSLTGNATFTITEVGTNFLKFTSDTPLVTCHSSGCNMMEKTTEFTVTVGETLKLDTGVMDAGVGYKIHLT